MAFDLVLRFVCKYFLVLRRFAKNHYLIILICLLALFVRVFGANFGLPDLFLNSDENEHLAAVFAAVDGGKSPYQEGLLPGGFYYLLAVFYYCYKFFVKNGGTAGFLLAARVFGGILSTIAVFVSYKIAKRLFDKTVGLLAAVVLSLTFLDVLTAHYVKEDIYLQLYGVLAVYFFLKAMDCDRIRDHLLGIGFIVLAVLTKINGLTVAVPYLLWAFLGDIRAKKGLGLGKFLKSNRKRYILGLLCLVLVFGAFLKSPRLPFRSIDESTGQFVTGENIGSKIDLKRMLYPGSSTQMFSSDLDGIKNYVWWPYYLMTSGFCYPLFFLVVFGLICLGVACRKEKVHPGLKYAVFAAASYYLLLSLQRSRFDRWFTLITPFISIFSAAGIVYFLRAVRRIRIFRHVFILSVVLVMGFSFFRAVLFDSIISQPDTRQEAWDWIVRNYSKENLILSGQDAFLNPFLSDLGYRADSLELDDPNFFKFDGEIFMDSSRLYQPIVNYGYHPEIADKFIGHKLLEIKGSVIKEFSSPFFDTGFFSPKILESGSQANYFHNPAIKIYEIPEIRALSEKPFEYDYNLEKIVAANPKLQEGVDPDGLRLGGGEGAGNKLIGGPGTLVPPGKYLLTYSLKAEDNNFESEIARISVSVVGSGKTLGSRSIRGKNFKEKKSYQDFSIEFHNPETQRLSFNFSLILPAELWVGGATLRESQPIVSKMPYKRYDDEDNLLAGHTEWDVNIVKDSGELVKIYEEKIDFGKRGIELVSGKEAVRLTQVHQGDEDIFGFSNSEYAGYPFEASAWVRSSRPGCVRIGFYRGNLSAAGWGSYDEHGSGGNYELIYYKDYFDAPYSKNGRAILEIGPDCSVEIKGLALKVE